MTTSTSIRSLVGLSRDQINFWIDGKPVTQISVNRGADGRVVDYWVHFGDGAIVSCKGHQKLSEIAYPHPVKPSFTQTYGEFGSSLGGRPYRG